jgi:hypothetical protein
VREQTGRAGDIDPAGLEVVAAGPQDAAEVHRLTLEAFARHASLDPPSGAMQETLSQVRADLRPELRPDRRGAGGPSGRRPPATARP